MVTTIDDMVTSLRDFIGSDARSQADRRLLTSITDAILDISTYNRWSYYRHHGRINTKAAYTTGLVYYDLGTKTLTFTSAIPSYAADCSINIEGVIYPIETRASNTTATLASPFFLQQTILLADAVPFELYQDHYVLPDDFTQIDGVLSLNCRPLSYVHPTEYLRASRYNRTGGDPGCYTIFGDGGPNGNNPGKVALALFPHPTVEATIDFSYRRTPREIRTAKYSEGSVQSSSSLTTLTGTNTSWTQAMVGSVIRLSADAVSEPTGNNGENPYEFEFFIKAVATSTSLTLSGTPTVSRIGIKYVISDQIDVDDKIMLRAVRRNVERQMSFNANMETKASMDATYKECLYQAIEADNRSSQMQAVGGVQGLYRQLVWGGDSL